MKAIISRCGFRCDLCPAYKKNLHSDEDQRKTSEGWFKYFGFRIPPDKILCDGCLAPDAENPSLLDLSCPVRPCAIDRGVPNCAHCDEYACGRLKQRLVDTDAVASRFAEPIPRQEYREFIRPYENKKLMDKIRSRIGKG